MPLYIYQCANCGIDEELVVPMSERDNKRKHSCGCILQRKMASFSFALKPTGRGMALDTLNSNHALPDRWYKAKGEKLAAAGVGNPPKTIW